MRKTAALVVAAALSFVAAPAASAHHDDGNGRDNDCQSGGCGTQDRHNGDNIHFERIGPVYICVQPGSCSPEQKGPQ